MTKRVVEIVAIIVIGGLVGFAMQRGYDGAILMVGITAAAGIAGYAIKKDREGS